MVSISRNSRGKKDLKDALIVIGSPFQLMCALEAIYHFQIKNYTLVVRTSDSRNGAQLSDLLKNFQIFDYEIIERTSASTFWKYVKLFHKLKKCSYERAFIGENGNAFRSLCFSLRPKEIYLLDDGVASIEERNYIEFPSFKYRWRTRVGKLRAYRYAFVGMTLTPPVRMSYFSVILDEPINGECLVVHRFSNVIKQIQTKKIKNLAEYPRYSAVFIDTPLIQARFLTEKDCAWMYQRAASLYRKETKIGYRPHRSQDLAQARRLLDASDYEFIPNNQPVELDFLLNETPEIIIGSVSTALITLKKIFPRATIVAIDIRERAIKARRLFSYEEKAMFDLYEDFARKGIQIV